MKLRQAALALMLVSLPVSASGQSTRPCVTEAEARHLIKLAMPDSVSGVIDRCRPVLAPEAFLVRSGTDFVARFKPGADQSWTKAKPVLLKLAGPQGKLLENFPDSAARPLLTTAISTFVSDTVKPEQCQLVDRALAAMAPLPDDNMAELVLLVAVAQLSRPVPAGQKPLPFSICTQFKAKPVPVNQPTATTATK